MNTNPYLPLAGLSSRLVRLAAITWVVTWTISGPAAEPRREPITLSEQIVSAEQPIETPRQIVAEWLRRIRAGNAQGAWDLTTRNSDAGWGPDLTSLKEFGRIRPVHQLGDEEVVMVVSNPFLDNAGQERVFYAVLLKQDDHWRIDRHGRAPTEAVKHMMRGIGLHPRVKCDVTMEELTGEWNTPCTSLELAADGTGQHADQTGAEAAKKPESIQWRVRGSSLIILWGHGETKWDVLWVDDDCFKIDYALAGKERQIWTWYRKSPAANR